MQRLMVKVIRTHMHHQVFVYLDDLLVITETFDQQLLLLSKVLCLRRAVWTLKIRQSKCMCLKEARYLEHITGNGTLCTSRAKVCAIQNFLFLKTVKQLRRNMWVVSVICTKIRFFSIPSWSSTVSTSPNLSPSIVK